MYYEYAYTTHGISDIHYRFYARLQFLHLYQRKWDITYTGLDHIPKDKPVLYVMKHRGFADISLHGMGSLWATSNLPNDLDPSLLWRDKEAMLDIISQGSPCRFVMKDELLSLPIGLHLVLNGGIPVPQDLETKAKNTPGFDPEDPFVLSRQKEFSTWANFKDSFREILQSLKKQTSIMIYGEATRVSGDQMGHLSLKLIQKLSRGIEIIPVGSVFKNQTMSLNYGPPCKLDELRDTIADLSEIPKSQYIS